MKESEVSENLKKMFVEQCDQSFIDGAEALKESLMVALDALHEATNGASYTVMQYKGMIEAIDVDKISGLKR